MAAFYLAIREFADKAGKNAELVMQKVGIDMLSKIILRSPVDTGRFRMNWQIGLKEVGYTVAGEDPTGQKAISIGTAKISGLKLGDSIWISNALPYGPRLENGYSRQAPAGMVKQTVAEYQQLVERAVKSVAT